MARHLTLADIGRGLSRHRAPRHRFRHVVTLLVVTVAVGGAAYLPQLRGSIHLPGIGQEDTPSGGAPSTSCRRGATDLVVAASVDKSQLLQTFAADFSRTGRDAAGRCVHVQIVPKSSGAAMTELTKGWTTEKPQPDVWSPSGSVWLPLLEARLHATQQASLIPAVDDVTSIATSPLVIAMPRPMAEVLGWPQEEIGWSDVLELSTSKAGWGAFDHPEWGPFLLGKTNPNFSHAGLEGTIAAYYAAVGRTENITPADIARADIRRFVAGVEQSIVRYGDTTVSYLSDWRRADDSGQSMRYISALLTEENLVASYNEGNPTGDPAQAGKAAKPRVPLVAIYPKEGTFIADHPYAVLSAPWVTDAKREAADAFFAYLRSATVQRAFQANHFRSADGKAGSADGPALGLLPSQPSKVFQPPAAAATTAILESWSQLRKTANMISLVDVSGSMLQTLPGSSVTRLAAAKQAAIASLDLFTDADEVGLWSFSGGVRGVKDYTEQIPIGPMNKKTNGEERRQAMREALQNLRAGGDTGLYNSVAAAYEAVLARYQADRINAVVVLTDGRNDAKGGLSLDALLDLLQRDSAGRQVRIITIAYGPDADRNTLTQIARATKGASYYAPTTADIPKVYSAALSNI